MKALFYSALDGANGEVGKEGLERVVLVEGSANNW